MNEEQERIDALMSLLSECLSSMNQEGEERAVGIKDGKLIVEFNIVEVPEDNYIGFAGY